MQSTIIMPLGVVIERRELDNPWQLAKWRPVAVFPGAPEIDAWVELRRGPTWVQYHAATLPLELFRNESDGYRLNLSIPQPVVYVVLRSDPSNAGPHEVFPFTVTVSPHEAEAYNEHSDSLVEGVAMPDVVLSWVQSFIEQQPVPQPFRKRRRGGRADTAEQRPAHEFGPLVGRREQNSER